MARYKKNNRRYYLHRKVREFTTIKTFEREVAVNDRILSELTDTQRRYLTELNNLGYNLQYFIE